MPQQLRYTGRISSVPGADGFAFIAIASVTWEDGSPHDLDTTQDIFLHQDDCAVELVAGTDVIFDVTADRKREKAYRATGASEYRPPDLLPTNESPIPGFGIAVSSARTGGLPATRLTVHAAMKQVAPETVAQVGVNQPMPDVPRVDDVRIPKGDPRMREILQQWLAVLFPHMSGFGTDYNVLDPDDAALDRETEETAANYEALGLTGEIPVMHEEVKRFKDMRSALAFMCEEGLVRHDTVIPIRYLPDLFMAVPVWYHWLPQDQLEAVAATWTTPDPRVPQEVQYFCGLFPNQRWCDAFQLWNRRVRTLRQYHGEVIPPHVARRMRTAVELFDYVVIATPYHDQAGMDWDSLSWLRSIDPYVVGFKKGIPYYFILARFSDAGTFPLFEELVADTIEFLRGNIGRLANFNSINSPFWCTATGGSGLPDAHPFGDYLHRRVRELLEAFEAGNLFDWLRGEV